METKEFKIQVPEGYEIDKEKSTFEKIVFKKVDDLPKSWDELKKISGAYVNENSKICDSKMVATYNFYKNMFPSKEEAEACLALAQLCQLRDRYNGGWKPDWEEHTERKHCIEFCKNVITKYEVSISRKVLHFKTEELRDRFLENFKDLIEIAKPLL